MHAHTNIKKTSSNSVFFIFILINKLDYDLQFSNGKSYFNDSII